MSAGTKQDLQLARQFLRLSMPDGRLSAEHVTGVLEYVDDPTLDAVVKHYSELSPDRLHQDGEALLLRPLRLTPAESADLVAFLESLSDDGAGARMPQEATASASRCR